MRKKTKKALYLEEVFLLVLGFLEAGFFLDASSCRFLSRDALTVARERHLGEQ